MITRHALLLAATALFTTAGCAGPSEAEDDMSESEDALSILPCTLTGGTESYDGIAGTYKHDGFPRRGQIRTMTVSAVNAEATKASYQRRLRKACAGAGCDEESGTMSMLPDNAAFTNSFSFTPAGASQPSDLYFVLGVKRSAGVVTEMCVAHVITATNVESPFTLKRVP